MAQTNRPAPVDTHEQGPSFLKVVLLALVALLVILLGIFLIVHARGTKMIPHGPNPQPNSRLVLPAQQTVAQSA